MLCTDTIYDAVAQGSGAFQHGHTYLGHPTACAAANAVLDRLLGDGLVDRVHPTGEILRQALTERFGQHPHIGDIRGRGLFQGLELVSDRETKAAFDPSAKLNAKIKALAFEAGLICYPMGGTIDGKHGDHVLLAPPFILNEDQVGELVDKLEIAINGALAAAAA
jgi:adenosylmethionine-8-amino-7-oxononanoate aminotransferase